MSYRLLVESDRPLVLDADRPLVRPVPELTLLQLPLRSCHDGLAHFVERPAATKVVTEPSPDLPGRPTSETLQVRLGQVRLRGHDLVPRDGRFRRRPVPTRA